MGGADIPDLDQSFGGLGTEKVAVSSGCACGCSNLLKWQRVILA